MILRGSRSGYSALRVSGVWVVCALGVWGHAAPPSAVRCVQIAASATPSEAQAKAEAAEAAGFGPVWLRAEGGTTRVLVGRCERLPDAILLKKSLRARGFPDAFEKAFPGLVAGDFETEATTPDPPLVYPPAGWSGRTFSEDDVHGGWRVAEMEFLSLRHLRLFAAE